MWPLKITVGTKVDWNATVDQNADISRFHENSVPNKLYKVWNVIILGEITVS